MSIISGQNIFQLMQPELALIVACAHTQISERDKQIIHELLSKKLDWAVIINNAFHHKVISLLYNTLSTQFQEYIPKWALDKIKEYHKDASLYTFILSASLTKVIQLLTENNIEVLPIKGAILSKKLYGSASMRLYTDVDILVHQHDIQKTLNLLVETQYTMLPEGISQSTFLKFMKYYHHGRLVDNNGVLIELHGELSGFYAPEPITLKDLKPFLIRNKFNDQTTLDLTDEMLFIFLCLHGSKHCWAKLDYICSISELLRIAPDLNWTIINDLAKKYKMINRVMISILLAKKLFASLVPEVMEDYLSRKASLNTLANKIIANEWSHGIENSRTHPIMKIILYQPALMDKKLDAIRFILRALIVPEHEVWHASHLPDSLFCLYFFYKPYRALTMPFRKKKLNPTL
jgi:hypothetical protein